MDGKKKIGIYEVKTRKQLKQFIDLPKSIYGKSDPWVPPIWRDELTAYDAKHNPILANSDFILYLAELDKKTVGRILVYIDHSFNDFYKSKYGLFGAFEAIDDTKICLALFHAGEEWAKARGMCILRGPINPVAEHWGFLTNSFDQPPIFLSPYNPDYYNRAIENAGFKKIKDLFAYEADMEEGYTVPGRFLKFRNNFRARNPEYSLRRLSRKNLMKDAESIWRLTNEALADNWGYVPVDKSVVRDMVKRLKPILDPDAIWFVDHAGSPVGYCLGFPDLNRILKKIDGKLYPFGLLRIFFGIKKVRHYRLFGLAILPEYHGRGLDVLLYTRLQDALRHKKVRMEANYILEDNMSIKNALVKLGMKQIKTYRVYEKGVE